MYDKIHCLPVKAIKEGSVIGIFSPSEPVVESRIEKFNSGISILERNGFKVKLSNNVFKHTFYSAGDIATRVNDIHALIDDEEVDILLSSWGGKSCSQLLPFLDYDKIKMAEKPILGFSDPCVLTNYISAKTNLVTFYGPNVVGKLTQTEHSDIKILKSTLPDNFNILGNVEKIESKVLKAGKGTGRLFGGNLSTFVLGAVCSDIPYSFFYNGIFLWEELSMPIQIIDQYMTALKNLGIIKHLSGMVIGHFLCDEKKEWKRADEFDAINAIFSGYDFPIIYCPTFGHVPLENPIFPIGALCELDTNSRTLVLKQKILR